MLPTPTAQPYGTGGNGIRKGTQKQVLSLQTMAAKELWPTPRASLNENRQTKPTPSQIAGTHGASLCAMVFEREKFPTPTARDSQGGSSAGLKREGSPSLREFVREPDLMPTPRASDSREPGLRSGTKSGQPLAAAVKLWPTPRASQSSENPETAQRRMERHKAEKGPRAGGGRGGGTMNLVAAVQMAEKKIWPTPVTTDAKSAARHTTTTGIMHAGTTLTDAARQEQGWPEPPKSNRKQPSKVLNPEFVAWLMGYPRGWTWPDREALNRLNAARSLQRSMARRRSTKASGTKNGRTVPA